MAQEQPTMSGVSTMVGTEQERAERTGRISGCAASVLEQLPRWFEDYNAVAPHSALGMKSPWQYQSEQGQRVVS